MSGGGNQTTWSSRNNGLYSSRDGGVQVETSCTTNAISSGLNGGHSATNGLYSSRTGGDKVVASVTNGFLSAQCGEENVIGNHRRHHLGFGDRLGDGEGLARVPGRGFGKSDPRQELAHQFRKFNLQ